MSRDRLSDVNIIESEVLPSPAEVLRRLPQTSATRAFVFGARERVRRILDGADARLLVIVGPCSIHHVGAAMEYARRLKALETDIGDALMPVMRVYFEKPRTVTGWKGFINDPDLDDSFRIDQGLLRARELLRSLAELELPAATEALDPITPQYIGDLISWTGIGARTTESQTHREMASGLSTPVGFKNGTDGGLDVAVNAIRATRHPHHFLGITGEGRTAVFHTRGNAYAHIVLRGGPRPNYGPEAVAACEEKLRVAGLPLNILIDCSHGNSGGDPGRQPRVMEEGVRQILAGNRSIVGFMVESHLGAGKQAIPDNRSALRPDVSVTDACVDWATTEAMLRGARERLRDALPGRRCPVRL